MVCRQIVQSARISNIVRRGRNAGKKAVVLNSAPDGLITRMQELVTCTTKLRLAEIAISEGIILLLQVASSEAVVGGMKAVD